MRLHCGSSEWLAPSGWPAKIGAALLATVASSPALAATGDDAPAAVPYRPSVSTPAALSAPGWLEIEGGFSHGHDGAARRDSVPVTLKLAFSPDWGVWVGSDAWVRLRDGSGANERGYGDTAVVVKRRFALDDDDQALGLEAGATLPTARRGLGSGSGKSDYGVNAIYSGDFGAWHTDLNIVVTRLGQVDAGSSRTQLLGAAAVSRSLDERWGVVGELSGTHHRGVDSTRQFLLAASYNVSKRLVVDAGAARSLRGGAPAWSAFTGFTWLAARVF